MYTLLVLIATIAAILLIVIVLLQSSKGGGLAGTFGGVGGMGTMFGTRRTADFLSKATWWLAGALAIIALGVNLFFLPGKLLLSKEVLFRKVEDKIYQLNLLFRLKIYHLQNKVNFYQLRLLIGAVYA